MGKINKINLLFILNLIIMINYINSQCTENKCGKTCLILMLKEFF